MAALKVYPDSKPHLNRGEKEQIGTNDPVKEIIEAVQHNNLEKAELVAKKAKDIQKLLSHAFETEIPGDLPETISKSEQTMLGAFQFQCLWHLVAYCAANNLIQFFLLHKADISVQDTSGDNFVHLLIQMSIRNRERANDFERTFETLVRLAPPETMKWLLLQENMQGIRPLEMASKYESWKMFLAIFSVKGTYILSSNDYVSSVLVKYAITEYKAHPRIFKSPIYYFMNMSKQSAEFVTEHKSVLSLFRLWTDFELKLNRVFLFSNILLQFLLLLAYYNFSQYVAVSRNEELITNSLLDFQNTSNRTQSCFAKAFESQVAVLDIASFRWLTIAFLLLGSLLELLFSFAVFISWMIEISDKLFQKKGCKLFKRRDQLTGSFVTRGMWSLYGILIFVAVLVELFELHGYNVLSFTNHTLFFSGILLISLFSLVNYAVMIDSGVYFIMIQSMSLHLVHFLFLYALFCIPFIASSQRLLLKGKAGECIYYFKFSVGIVYSLILYLIFSGDLAMITLASADQENQETKDAIKIVFVVFIVLVGLILMNFLIGLFSFSAADIKSTQEIHLLVWRLRVS